MNSVVWLAFLICVLTPSRASCQSNSQCVDLTHAVVILPVHHNAIEVKAAQFLVEEVEKRTRIRWEVRSQPGRSVWISIGVLGPGIVQKNGRVHPFAVPALAYRKELRDVTDVLNRPEAYLVLTGVDNVHSRAVVNVRDAR